MYKHQQDNKEIQRKPVARAMQCANQWADWPEGQRALHDLCFIQQCRYCLFTLSQENQVFL